MASNDDNIAMDPTQRAETGMPGSIYELRTCPYNPSHKVGVTRFPMHLVRCREQHPKLAKEMEICFFNSTHHVKRSELSHHYQLCSSYWEFAERHFSRHLEDMKGQDDGKKRKHKKPKTAPLPVVGTYKLHTEKLLPGDVADSEDEYDNEGVAWALIDKKFTEAAAVGPSYTDANGAYGTENSGDDTDKDSVITVVGNPAYKNGADGTVNSGDDNDTDKDSVITVVANPAYKKQ